MNAAIQCILLLACITICTSASSCRCVKTVPAVREANIDVVMVLEPRPYCSRREVIVILRNKTKFCLDPESNFTAKILRKEKAKEMKKASENRHSETSSAATRAATSTSAATSSTSVTNQRRL